MRIIILRGKGEGGPPEADFASLNSAEVEDSPSARLGNTKTSKFRVFAEIENKACIIIPFRYTMDDLRLYPLILGVCVQVYFALVKDEWSLHY